MINLSLNNSWNIGQSTIMMFSMGSNGLLHPILSGYTFLLA